MGLLDRLIRKGTDAVVNGVIDSITGSNSKPAQPAVSQPNRVTQPTAPTVHAKEVDAATKIRNVLIGQFSQYSFKENVSPTLFGGEGKFLDYSFVIYDGATPKLIIMMIGKTTCSSRYYRWSKEVADKNNITLINFVEHYPNEIAYISERLHKYL